MVVGEDAAETIAFICKNKKNVTRIQEHLTKLEEGKTKDILSVVPILTGVFTFYTRKKTWRGVNAEDMDIFTGGGAEDTPLTEKQTKERAERKVNQWLYQSYKSYMKFLLGFLAHKAVSVHVKSLEALLEVIEAEYVTNLLVKSNVGGQSKLNFPNGIYVKVIKRLLTLEKLSPKLVEQLNVLFTGYDDLCFYCLRNIHSLLENQKLVQNFPSAVECIPRNTYEILTLITNKSADLENEICLYIDVEEVQADTTEMVKSYKQTFSTAWMALLHLPKLPVIIQKKVLLNLDTKIMPQLVDPKLLIDFLTDSYDAGGVCSLLALNGLFVLINQYNLDYPEFYTKLYVILEANIFHTKYKSRFFYLLDLFLTSSHLPAYLVMAFVKKLARIALFTPGEDLFMLLKFIKNLLIRHPSSRILIHRQNENDVSKTVSTDPFKYEEEDPYESNASRSCLWELESLKSHYSKDVLKLLLSFRKEFPIVEDDITQYFDKDFESIIAPRLDEEMNDEKLPPYNFEKRKEIFVFDNAMWTM